MGAGAELGFWRIAGADPGRVALVDGAGGRITYGELLDSSRSVANGLRRVGLAPGDAVAAVLPNCRAFFEALLATSETGLYFVPVNRHLATDEIEHVVDDSESRVVVIDHLETDAHWRALDRAGLDPRTRLAVGHAGRFRPYAELLANDPVAPPDRTAGTTMMYTSGTTGKPKGVRRPLPDGDPDDHFGNLSAITCQGFGVPVGRGAHLVCGPLYHAGPFVGAVNALHAGLTVVLMERWTPEGALELIQRHRISSTQMVPTMFHQMLALPAAVRTRYDVSSLCSVFHTGAPCPVQVKQQMMDWWGPVVYETYGGTEGVATIATPKRWLERPGSVGKAIHGVTVRILDDSGEEVTAGVPGNVWIEPSGHPPEYFKDPEKTRRMRRGRMVTLGDVGYLDPEGFLFICDRKIDMIISGGVNIYPAEVEAALLADDRVVDAAVIGVPDDELGEQVKAVVQLASGVEPGPALAHSIVEACQARIARFKCPRSVDFVDHLPRLPNGKIEKRRLRDPYWLGRGRVI